MSELDEMQEIKMKYNHNRKKEKKVFFQIARAEKNLQKTSKQTNKNQ